MSRDITDDLLTVIHASEWGEVQQIAQRALDEIRELRRRLAEKEKKS